MTDKELAAVLVEDASDANIDKKVAAYVNRLLLRLHTQPAMMASLVDVTTFKPNIHGGTEDQVSDGEFNEEGDDEGARTKNDPTTDNDKEDDSEVVVQLSFKHLPQEVIQPLIRLIAAPRSPELFRYVKDGQARTGIQLKLKPDDFPGDEYDYAF